MIEFRIGGTDCAVFRVEENGITQCINDPTVYLSLAQARDLAGKLRSAIVVTENMTEGQPA